jgi:hypothetical protein
MHAVVHPPSAKRPPIYVTASEGTSMRRFVSGWVSVEM